MKLTAWKFWFQLGLRPLVNPELRKRVTAPAEGGRPGRSKVERSSRLEQFSDLGWGKLLRPRTGALRPVLVRFALACSFGVRVNSVLTGCALLAAEPDRTGPRLLSAVVDENGATNLIRVKFDERLLSSSARDKGNYAITLFGTTNQVPIQGVFYTDRPSPTATVFVGASNWHLGGVSNYYLTVNRVRDLADNTIAPDSRAGLAWPRYTEVLRPNAVWRYAAIGPAIIQEPWAACDYVENSRWAEGPGPFCSSGWLPPECGCIDAGFGFQGGPALFRTKFVCPPEYATNGLLRFDWLVKDGAIFYLNGVEMSRRNLCPAPAQLNGGSPCCVNFIAPPLCGTSLGTVTNLVAGTNCLAVAVLPCYCVPVSICGGSDIAFGLGLSAARLVPGPVPAENLPQLQIAPHSNNVVRLSWTGSGYALETTTNLPGGAAASTPGPWLEVPDVSNPYTNSIQPHPDRFFRLRK